MLREQVQVECDNGTTQCEAKQVNRANVITSSCLTTHNTSHAIDVSVTTITLVLFCKNSRYLMCELNAKWKNWSKFRR